MPDFDKVYEEKLKELTPSVDVQDQMEEMKNSFELKTSEELEAEIPESEGIKKYKEGKMLRQKFDAKISRTVRKTRAFWSSIFTCIASFFTGNYEILAFISFVLFMVTLNLFPKPTKKHYKNAITYASKKDKVFEMIKLFDKSYELPFKAPDETDPFKDFAVTNGIINFMGVRWNSTSKLARCVKVFQAAVGFVAFIRWVKTIIKNVYYIYISPIDPNLKFEAMDITTPGTEMWEFTEEKHSGFDFGIWNNKKIKKLVLKGEGKKKFEALVKEFEAKGKSKKGRGTQRDKNGEKRKWRTHVKRNWIDYDKFNDDNSDFFVGTYDEDGEKILVNVKDFGGLSTLDPNQVAIYQMDKNGNFIDMLPLNDFITSYHSDNEDDNAPDYDAKDYEAKSDKSPLNGFVKKRWPKKRR